MVVVWGRSGLTICIVLDMRLSLATVFTMDGAGTTVDTTRTFQLHAIPAYLRTVSDNGCAFRLMRVL